MSTSTVDEDVAPLEGNVPSNGRLAATLGGNLCRRLELDEGAALGSYRELKGAHGGAFAAGPVGAAGVFVVGDLAAVAANGRAERQRAGEPNLGRSSHVIRMSGAARSTQGEMSEGNRAP